MNWGLYSIWPRSGAMGDEGHSVGDTRSDRAVRRARCGRGVGQNWRVSWMRYMVMTTKHHEGFCLFDSKLTDYCASRAGRARLVRNTWHRAREKLAVASISTMDWHHPDGDCQELTRRREGDLWNYTHGNLRKLMSNYERFVCVRPAVPMDAKVAIQERPDGRAACKPYIIITNRNWQAAIFRRRNSPPGRQGDWDRA